MKKGFDNKKYIKIQSKKIKERFKLFDKLYLEIGGKLFDDYHASRVLPGFEPDVKINILKELKDERPYPYGMVGYLVKNTITENGSVKRGVCEVSGDDLVKLTESAVERIEGKIIASPLSGQPAFEVQEDGTVSMNMLLFTPSIFEYIEDGFPAFLDDSKDNLEKCEYLIPDVVFERIENDNLKVRVVDTNAVWHGVTYKEDKPSVVASVNELVKNGVYPEKLWN